MIILKLIFWPVRILFYLWHKFFLQFTSGSLLIHKVPSHFVNNQPTGLLTLFTENTDVLFSDYIQELELFEKSKQLKTLIINASHLNLTWSQISIVTQRFKKIEKSGKKLIAYTEGGGLKCLYLMAFIKKRYATPHAGFTTLLPSGESFFLKNVLNKVGVKLETSYAGKFKAGGFETFTRTSFSPAAKKSQSKLIGDFRKNMLAEFESIKIKQKKSTKTQTMSDFIKRQSLMDAEDLKEAGFFLDLVPIESFFDYLTVDNHTLIAQEQVHDFFNNNLLIRKKNNKTKKGDIEPKTIESNKKREASKQKALKTLIEEKQIFKYEYRKNYTLFNFRKTRRAAIVVLEGNIGLGTEESEGKGNSIQALPLRKTFKELETSNEEVIFLLINSPGGSAEGSEILFQSIRSLSLIKPVIAVISDIGASGGYYLACAANQIYANSFSMLGSIGVIRLRPELSGLYKKIGIKKEKLFKDPTADIYSENGAFSPASKKLNQDSLNKTYQLFLKRVSEGRNLTINEVLKQAEGQVFLSQTFIQSGMIEQNKDLLQALNAYKEQMKYKPDTRFHLSIYPEVKLSARSLVSSGMPSLFSSASQLLLNNSLLYNKNTAKSLEYLSSNLNELLYYSIDPLE